MRSWQRLVLWQIIGMVNGCSNVHSETTSPNCDAGSIVFDGGMNTIDAGRTPDAGLSIPRLDGGEQSLYRAQWGVTAPLAQLVSEIYTVPSGWTNLTNRLATRNQSHLPPLQERYVTAFDTLESFTESAAASFSVVGNTLTTLRLPLVWPLWANNDGWDDRMVTSIQTLQQHGWEIRPELMHNESYPADLDTGNPNNSGWAHTEYVEKFTSFVNASVDKLKHVLPAGTIMYLAVEPEAVLWNGYLNDEGKWPPGGTRSGYGLAQGLINLRNALLAAVPIVRRAGFRAALAVNVMPIYRNTPDPIGMPLAGYLRSWWLADQLILGPCIQESEMFLFACTRTEPPGLDTLGITFYGNAVARNESVSFGTATIPPQPLALLSYELQPNATLFQGILADAIDRYRQHPVRIEVAEFGFSGGDMELKVSHLINYKRAMACNQIQHATMHTLFLRTAEFSAYEWNFGIIRDCGNDYDCTITPWGTQFMREISYPSPPNPCIE